MFAKSCSVRVAAGIAAVVLSAAASQVVAASELSAGSGCASFTPRDVRNGARIDRVQPGAAEEGQDKNTHKDQSDTCVIRGSIVSSPTSTIHFRVDLPAKTAWNTKLMMFGGGGFDGFIPTDGGRVPASGSDLQRLDAYARVSSDSGHQGRGASPALDFSWVTDNPAALRNHAYEANHLVLWAAVDIAEQYYGKAPTRRYIIGASNGGRAGLVAIQHHPEDYDGVISLEPAIAQDGFAANLVPQMFQHIFASPENWLNRDQLALFEKAELDACDDLDGLKDGILSNPNACHYDGKPLLCRTGQAPSKECLTAGQIESIRLILRDKDAQVPLADGVVGYPGYGRGAQTEDWVTFIFGSSFAARDGSDFVLAENIVKWGITKDPNAALMTHDPTKWKDPYLALSSEIDATNPDLSAFHARGGRLLIWYGLSDGCVTYKRTANYLDTVTQKLGKPATQEFIRFFTAPGIGHRQRGPGANQVNLVEALENWVEKGKAPEQLVAAKTDDSGKVLLTRPLCQYPLFPRYKGKGDPNVASSFKCSSS
jgi:feruloyl esterase